MTSGERKNGPGGTVSVFGPESGTFPLRSTTTPRRNESPCVGRQPQPCRHCCPFTGPWTTSMRRPAWRITSRQPTTTINNLRDTSGVIPIVGQAANWRALQFAAGQFPADRVSIGGRSQPTHSRVGDSTKPTMTCNYIPAKTVKVFFFVRRLVPATRDVRNPRSWWRGTSSRRKLVRLLPDGTGGHGTAAGVRPGYERRAWGRPKSQPLKAYEPAGT